MPSGWHRLGLAHEADHTPQLCSHIAAYGTYKSRPRANARDGV